MIIGIGCDVVDHETTKLLDWGSQIEKLERIFCEEEIKLFERNSNIKYLAGRFAVKEAVVKCLASGMEDGISLNHIKVVPGENGQPQIELFGYVKKISEDLGITKWHASISHSPVSSIAFVVAEK